MECSARLPCGSLTRVRYEDCCADQTHPEVQVKEWEVRQQAVAAGCCYHALPEGGPAAAVLLTSQVWRPMQHLAHVPAAAIQREVATDLQQDGTQVASTSQQYNKAALYGSLQLRSLC